MKGCIVFALAGLSASLFGEELKNGTFYALEKVPAELIARSPAGTPVRFVLEENGTTGYQWEIDSNTNECEVAVEHRGAAANGLVGASGRMSVTVTRKVQTPARVEFRYRRPWEKDVKPIKSVRFILYTAADKVASPLYPDNAVNRLLKKECEKRGIVITDWHLHIRGGMTPEMAVERERASGIRSSAMENHGREWE
ncbi:MAG: protease inhibitor I42 family protein, partial [bacterium]|nr:protease inhibitor I42 family protein [Candidatus Colisoma equi]